MKHFRGLKRPKIIKDQDAQKLAEQKLALLSDQPFNQQFQNSQRWAFPQTHQKILQKEPQQNKKLKATKNTSESSKVILKNNFFRLKDRPTQTSDLKNYCRIYCNEHNIKSDNLFPQKKSLSLTNYMLFDKRSSEYSNQKNILSKHEEKKIKLLRLKKILLPKQKKNSCLVSEKLNEKSDTNSSYRVKINLRNFSLPQSRKATSEQSPNNRDSRQSNRSFYQVSRVLSGIIKRKQFPNISLEQYHQSYFTAKKKLQEAIHIESSMSSSKIKLHQHLQKYTY